MNADQNLLFGVMALQADLIDPHQFVDACAVWASRKEGSLGALLVERGWILKDDQDHLDYLLQRKLERHGGSVGPALASVPDEVKRSLAALGDADLQRSLSGEPQPADWECLETVDWVANPDDRYRLTRLHASGGIGRVWLARDRSLGREIALKELQPERAHDSSLCTRFLREARITGQLEHPGVVPVYELARRPASLQPFYTMRFVKGRTLSEATRAYHDKRLAGHDDSLEFLGLLTAFVTVCNTIAYAHSRGVVHRDLKGQNVVLADFGEVVILDWGLAKLINQNGPESNTAGISLDTEELGDPELTVAGQTLGTPAYMAPEQAAGIVDQIGVRTDVYGLGAVLYEILTGRPPFYGPDTREVLRKVREEPPIPPRELWDDAPSALEEVCLRALAKRPSDRHASASELAMEVQGWQEKQRLQAEELLRQSEALYHSLVEMLPLQVWRKDRESHFTFVNRGFCEATGRRESDLIGRTDFDLFPAELAEKYRQDDQRVLSSGETFEDIEEHVTAKGEKLHVHVVKRPIFDAHGQIVGTQGIFWDVTDRKRLRDALDRVTAELNATREQLMLVQGAAAQSRIAPACDPSPELLP
jgi:PAS domain S-box-containing protein